MDVFNHLLPIRADRSPSIVKSTTEMPKQEKSGKEPPVKVKIRDLLLHQSYSDRVKKLDRPKIKIFWENPFILRATLSVLSTTTAGVFAEASLPLDETTNLLLHVGVCAPIFPILALFSSAAMLDRNTKSPFITYILLIFSGAMYLIAILAASLHWAALDMNETKFDLVYKFIIYLSIANLALILVDIVATLTLPWYDVKQKIWSLCRKKKQLRDISGSQGRLSTTQIKTQRKSSSVERPTS